MFSEGQLKAESLWVPIRGLVTRAYSWAISVHQLLGERDSTTGPQGCSHCFSVQTQGRTIRPFKLPRRHSALNCRQNLSSRIAE